MIPDGGDTPPKRQIKPHKGGRTARIDLRATPEVKQKARDLAKRLGCSVDDLFEKLIEANYEI